MNHDSSPRYCDYYGMMTYADFTAWVEAGMPATYSISNSRSNEMIGATK